MTVGRVNHQALEFGVVRTAVYPFKAGVYKVTVSHVDTKLTSPDYDYRAMITWSNIPPGFTVSVSDPEDLLGTFYTSYVDRTVGKRATLTIEEEQAVCQYSTCVECWGHEDCR